METILGHLPNRNGSFRNSVNPVEGDSGEMTCKQCIKLNRDNAIMKEMLDIIEQDGGDTGDLRKEALANLRQDKKEAPHVSKP